MPLPPPKKVDQVFQLSLTELAFVLIFLLLLLSGAIVLGLQREVEDERQKVVDAQNEADDAQNDRDAAEEIYINFEKLLKEKKITDPNEIVSELIKKSEEISKRKKLEKEVEDLKSKLTALEKVEEIIKKSQPEQVQEKIDEAIQSALALQAAIENEMGEKVEVGKEADTAKKLADIAKILEEAEIDPSEVPKVVKENRDLLGQVRWLRDRLYAGGGRDDPPCWADEETGKPQYLFRIVIKEKGLSIEKAWPEVRAGDALALPGIKQLLTGKTQSLPLFKNNMRAIDQECRQKNCRHYVILENSVNDLNLFNKYRYGVEQFFYKYEVRSF